MDVRCDKCQARYRIDDARVGPAGLTMRCGKCGNTFKVTKDGSAPPPPTRPAPAAPPPASDVPGSTMMFQAPKIPPAPAKVAPSAPPSMPAAETSDVPGSTMMFQAPKIPPAPTKAAPSAPPAIPAAEAGDVPGSTMMFQAPKIPPAAAKPAPKLAPAPKPADGSEDSGSTMMFGTAPVNAPEAKPSAPPAAKPAPKVSGAEDSGSTMMFGTAPVAAKPAPRGAPVADPDHAAGDEETASGNETPPDEALDPGDESTSDEPVQEPMQAKPGEAVGEDEIDPSAMTGEASILGMDMGDHPPPRKPVNPQKGAMVLFAITGVAVLALAVVAFVVWEKVRVRPPSAAAIQTMNEARTTLNKDTLASFPQALDTDASAIAAAPKSPFPEARALQSEIELAWSDALADQAQLLADKSARTYDDKQKADADAASQKAATESKLHFKSAFDSAKAANTLSPTSADVHLALADYYRAAKSAPNYEREMKKAASFKAPEARMSAIEGARLLGEDDGAEKALAKLKAALAADPQNAGLQYRIAQAQALLKNEPEEKKALEATLKLSPSHERARLMLEALNVADATPKANAPAPGGQ